MLLKVNTQFVSLKKSNITHDLQVRAIRLQGIFTHNYGVKKNLFTTKIS